MATKKTTKTAAGAKGGKSAGKTTTKGTASKDKTGPRKASVGGGGGSTKGNGSAG
ncbi:hypothetical protein [Polyangium jinanense]|uniref:Uncharacterized protein n=1 Tax=Polyangium jinanense TaxID=2829994 RepID=A0A9X3X9W1_9BACT|nr:hypothetical protein [Polyangium jinanense]MDC3960619.1 hypothetical protein [Polyangium jinanense]MDC3986907.1 hypothetical protein [Polyangium jinanense]